MCRPWSGPGRPGSPAGPVARITANIWYWPSGNDGSRSTKLSMRCTPGCAASQRLRPYSSATCGAPAGEPAPKSRIDEDARGVLAGKSRRTSSSPRRDSASAAACSTSLEASRMRSEGRAQQEQDGRHRDEHEPGVAHDHGGQAHPEAAPAVRAPPREDRQPPGVQARAEHRQQRGQEREPVEHGEEDDERAAEPDRSQVAEPERVEAEQPDGHGEAGEEDRRARPWPSSGRAPPPRAAGGSPRG